MVVCVNLRIYFVYSHEFTIGMWLNISYFTDIKYSVRIVYVFVAFNSELLIHLSSVPSNYRNFHFL
jgi:hypothetical protein